MFWQGIEAQTLIVGNEWCKISLLEHLLLSFVEKDINVTRNCVAGANSPTGAHPHHLPLLPIRLPVPYELQKRLP